MTMTRKDFAAIASAINNALKGRGDLVGNVGEVLASTNPRFDKARFAHACLEGIGEDKDKPLTLGECEVGMRVKVISVGEDDMDDVFDFDWLNPNQLTRV